MNCKTCGSPLRSTQSGGEDICPHCTMANLFDDPDIPAGSEEVEEVFPEWIRTRDNSSPLKEGESAEPENIKTISISGFEALTVDALRELRVEKSAEIAKLEDVNQSLENRVKALEQKLTTIVSALEAQENTTPQTVSLK